MSQRTQPCELQHQDVAQRAVDALQDLIVFTAQRGGAERFGLAAKLCRVADDLVSALEGCEIEAPPASAPAHSTARVKVVNLENVCPQSTVTEPF